MDLSLFLAKEYKNKIRTIETIVRFLELSILSFTFSECMKFSSRPHKRKKKTLQFRRRFLSFKNYNLLQILKTNVFSFLHVAGQTMRHFRMCMTKAYRKGV